MSQETPKAEPATHADPKGMRGDRLCQTAGNFGKPLLIVALLLLLAFVLELAHDLIAERAAYQAEAERAVHQAWGPPQTLAGPLLRVPFRRNSDHSGGRLSGWLVFAPTKLRIEGDMTRETRRRGIFDIALYQSVLKLSGNFDLDFPEDFDPETDRADWSEAGLYLGLSEIRGLRQVPRGRFSQSPLNFNAARGPVWLGESLRAALPPDWVEAFKAGAPKAVDFEIDLALAGSRSLSFRPTAPESEVRISSDWPHPSFGGDALPLSHEREKPGFDALWRLLPIGQVTPRARISFDGTTFGYVEKSWPSRLSVALVAPVNIYSSSLRAAKYGALIVILVFATLFLLELRLGLKLHAAHYALTGFALCLFFLLLIALAEVIGFGVAYLFAAALVCGQVLLYLKAVLEGLARAALVGGVLAGVFGFIYVTLRLEDLALLTGAAGLFTALAVLMYATRRLDWHRLRFREGAG